MLNRVLLAITAFLLFAGTALASPPACTITMNADYTTVHAFFVSDTPRAPVDGDVVCLNSTGGSPTSYPANIDITKGGTIATEVRGAGTIPTYGSAGLTQIYIAANGALYGFMVPGSSYHPTIDNIKFIQDVSSNAAAEDIDVNPGNGQAGLAYILHHNDFLWTGTCNGKGIVTSVHNGLIYRNVFRTELLAMCGYTNTSMAALELAYSEDGSSWQSSSTLGAADSGGTTNIYVENNQFYGFTIAADFQQSTRGVFRFNQMFNSSMADHGYDSGGLGTREVEYYNNQFKCGNYTNHGIELSSYIANRGGTAMILNNTFDAFDATWCSTNNMNPNKSAVRLDQYTARVCSGGAVQPGSYPGNYPLGHQTGWGWISGSNQLVGATAGNGGMLSPLNEFGAPGTYYASAIPNGFDQALQPYYFANNSNSAFGELYIETGYVGDCRAMSWSVATKKSATTTVIGPPSQVGYAIPYANVDMELVAVFSDNIGGTAPTIASSPSCSWSALSGGTNGALRLSAWHCTVTTGGPQTVTITHDSSTSARALTVVTLRGLTASPLDAHPAVHNDTAATTFTGTTTGTLSSSTEIVLGYYALAAPATFSIASLSGGTGYSDSTCDSPTATTGGSPNAAGLSVSIVQSGGVITSLTICSAGNGNYVNGDTITVSTGGANATFVITYENVAAGSGFNRAYAYEPANIPNSVVRLESFNGTTGGSDASVGVVFKAVDATTGIQPVLTDGTARDGISGTVSFKVNGNTTPGTASPLDNQVTDYLRENREYFLENASFTSNPTVGTGSGPRSSRPANCTYNSSTGVGVAYWSTDQGSWNTSGSGGQGVLDYCDSTDHWTNAWYVPYDYPNPLATVTGSGGCTPDHLAFIGQPSSAVLGAVLGTVSVGIYDSGDVLCTAETSTIIITNSGGTCTGMTLGGTSTGDAVAGVFTTTNLTESAATGACTIKGSFGALTDGTSSSFTISAAVQGTGGGIGSRIKLNVR